MALLDQIEGPNDIKKLSQNELEDLAREIRQFLWIRPGLPTPRPLLKTLQLL